MKAEFVENFDFSAHKHRKLECAVNVTSDDSANAPVAAQYVVTFLPPEMLHVYRQITALRTFRPVVFCQKRENADRFPFSEIVRLPKPRTHQLRRLWQKTIRGLPITIYRSEARRTLAELHRAEARVLHIYFGHIGVHLLPLLEICDVPVLVSFHGADAQVDFDKPAHLARTRRMFEKSTLLLVRSESIAKHLVAAGCDRAKIRLHRTGLPLAEIAFTQRATPTDGAWRCLQACRLISKKGLAMTVRAFARFGREYPAATLTIAGEGPLHAELRALAHDLGVESRVFFPGFISQPQLRALFAEAHLFLHPSELAADGNQEGVPNAMLEAMASGLPVLATTHGGIPEAVENGVSGMLVPERDDAALAEAMLALARDPERSAALGVAARKRVTEQFDLEVQTRVLEGHYREAMD
jgi:glycosyltransferase involved in cell wall biosynthesis